MHGCVAGLKEDFQSELYDPRIKRRSQPAEITTTQGITRITEIDIVEYVKELGPELYRSSLSHLSCFEEPQISIEGSGSKQDVLSCVSKSADGVRGKQGSIEPLSYQLIVRAVGTELSSIEVGSDKISPVMTYRAEGVVTAAEDREGEARSPDQDAVRLPAIQELARDSVPANGRYLPDIRELEDVWNVLVRVAIVKLSIEGVTPAEIVNRLRPGVIGQHRKPTTKPLLGAQL